MEVAVNTPIDTAIADPAGGYRDLGARVEVPVTRAIASYWRPGTLNGSMWMTTLDPVVQTGDYLVVWISPYDPPDVEIFIPLTVQSEAVFQDEDMPPVDTTAVKPSPDDVANLERTRTTALGSTDSVEFTSDTNPTIDEVTTLIDQATPLVLAELPNSFPTHYYDAVKHSIALYVALVIEGSHFREQEDSTSGGTWRSLYNAAILNLKRAINEDLAQWRLLKRIEVPEAEWARQNTVAGTVQSVSHLADTLPPLVQR